MLSCKQASLLASKKLDMPLTVKERIGFFIHISMCRFCRHYAKEIKMLHQFMRKTASDNDSMLSGNQQLSVEARERINQQIEEAIRSSKEQQ